MNIEQGTGKGVYKWCVLQNGIDKACDLSSILSNDYEIWLHKIQGKTLFSAKSCLMLINFYLE